MNDLRILLPHSKKESKLDSKDQLYVINEICDMYNCNNCIFFEVRKQQDLYMWIAKTPNGPSAKFLVNNVHTMSELKLTGNCLQGSRPLLVFDKAFDAEPYLIVIKELFTQVFSSPKAHPKTKPFIDHIFLFSLCDNRIWFRNYQIIEPNDKNEQSSLKEIGPQFVMLLMKIFSNGFCGATLYENPEYLSPNKLRRMQKLEFASKYSKRIDHNKEKRARQAVNVAPRDELDEVFNEEE